MNTHGLRIKTGRHAGELFTRLPVSYLNWMVNAKHGDAEIAKAELERRGTTMPTMELSGHAIDRASQIFFKRWLEDTDGTKKPGFHSWLMAKAQEAYKDGIPFPAKEGVKMFDGIAFVFAEGENWPTLKTVMRKDAGLGSALGVRQEELCR